MGSTTVPVVDSCGHGGTPECVRSDGWMVQTLPSGHDGWSVPPVRRTQVLLPAWSLPRRRDSTDSIGAALLMAARGNGHRTIAADLGRPDSTVRNWLRRFCQHTAWLHRLATLAAHQLDPDHGPMVPRATPLAEAVDMLGVAALAAVRRFGLARVSPWTIIAVVSKGMLTNRLPDG